MSPVAKSVAYAAVILGALAALHLLFHFARVSGWVVHIQP
jgi:hypothetical protein